MVETSAAVPDMHAAPVADVDPVMLAVVQGALGNIQLEMTATLQRSGRSNVATIARDYSNAIFDRDSELILQGQDLPVHLGSLIFGLKGVSAYFRDDTRPGDIYYHNDVLYGGSHNCDMCAYKPIFVDGELAFWSVSKLHVVDAGGPVPGSYNIEAKDMYAEGLRIPPIRLVDAGVLRQDILQFILSNVRTNENQAGDIRAQLGAVNVAEKRLLELCDKYGLDQVHAASDGLKNLAERQMREVVRMTPDGTTVGHATVEDTGHGLGVMEISATATVNGDELTITLGSPPQIPFFTNSYQSNTMSGVYLGIAAWAQLPPPYNEGLYRCITVDCGPRGSFLNAETPAPCMLSTSVPNENIADAVREALTIAMPRRAMAEWGRTFGATVAGIDPRTDKYFVNLLLSTLISGAGAIDELMDGWHMIGPSNCLGALTCGDTELIELLYPLIIHEYSIRQDSAGAGKWRGGCGNALTIESLNDMEVACWGQGMGAPANGCNGAVSAMPERKVARGIVTHTNGTRTVLETNRMFTLKPGELYTSVNAGGGGAGNPFERPPERVADDVSDCKVSVEAAAAEYGVVVDPETFEIDASATADLRRGSPTTAGQASAKETDRG
jgi:N-methylhydantoinase B